MAADANRCPMCGAERPVNAPEGYCPRCLLSQALNSDAPGPTDVDATTAPLDTSLVHPPETAPLDSEATGALTPAPVAGTTGDWATDPDDPATTADSQKATPDLPTGATVRYFGDYEIQKELGRGGMGVVYKARQVSLNRPVALKMIKAGVLADDAELQRFQNEAEAVALLDHAGIVPVYEVGEHEGQRYLSMKLVEGGSLAERLASFQANPKAAATLMAETAEAVHHAHMRGILHRDLKPANILVDPEGHPQVNDFGLAKRIEADVDMTASGAILGTPAYMSPEQVAGHRGTITTATDVYGLGAILYALLTGKAPFGGDSLVDTLQAVKERVPESPRSLNAKVPRDLETICLKCLEKDPRRRYASAQAFADDLRCWLDSRPIAARRVGPAERAWLWCKRKPALAGMAGALMLAVFGGTTGIFAVQAGANANLRSANGKLDQANTELRSSNILLDQQRVRSEDRETQAIDAVTKFRDAVAYNPELKDTPSLESLRKTLLKEPLAFFRSLRDRLQADQDTRPESLSRLAAASFELGKLTNEIGDKLEALTAFREALAIRQTLADAHPTVTLYQSDLARSQLALGASLFATGQPEEARRVFETALAIRQTLAVAHPTVTLYQSDLARSHGNLGGVLSATGQPDAARKAYETCRAVLQSLADAHPAVTQYQSDLAAAHNNLGLLLSDTGQLDAARKAHEAAREIQQTLADAHPADTHYQSELARSHNNLGLLLSNTGQLDAARKAHEAARAIQQTLADAHPAITHYQSELASSHNNLGLLLVHTGQPDAARKAFEAARTIFQALAEAYPGATQYQSDLAGAHNNLGLLLINTGQPDAARKAFEAARAIQQILADAHPTVSQYQSDLASTYQNIAILLHTMGKPAQSLNAFASGLAIAQRLVREHPEFPDYTSRLGGMLNGMASIDLDARRFGDARNRLQQAIVCQKKALAANPRNPTYRQYLANHLNNLIKAARGLGSDDEVAAAQHELDELKASNPLLAAQDARLVDVRQGKAPKDNAERLALAQRAYDTRLYASAAKLWAEALKTDPRVAESRQTQHRYNAACAAALAAAGAGIDNPPSDATARAKLRRQALDWLKAELAVWTKFVESGPPQAKQAIALFLKHWQEDTDLASIRGDKAVEALPEAERAAWRALWADVAALLEKARTAAGTGTAK